MKKMLILLISFVIIKLLKITNKCVEKEFLNKYKNFYMKTNIEFQQL